ncbi:methyl-accepting chemotaxis protein [Rhodohalobacter sp. 8-1]|uniref:methyl-accepting chemotaxis protein n=1 Tax=Rhodohalobacter sp. 8-1 TaxID=3131972 RepID=UPI0030EDF228
MNTTGFNIQSLFPAYDSAHSKGVQTQLSRSFDQTDQFMLKLLLIHWIVASTVIAIAFSTYLLGFVGGGLIFGTAYGVYKLNPGSLLSRMTMGAAFMAFSMLFIQQHLGRIEMHFHIFVSLAFLIRYKDIAPVLAATLTTAVHHALFNAAQDAELAFAGTPIMIFDYGCGWDIVAIHATFVLIAMGVYSSIILNLTREFIKNAEVYDIIDHLNDSVEYTSDAADFISESGQELAMDASNNTESVQSSFESIKVMNGRIKSLNEKTSSAKEKVELINDNSSKMNRSMEELKESSLNITSIIKTIDSIASQTNLLALNAAVEAARAGEAGAGFAVVTDEVRVLAQKTAKAASDIGNLIENNAEKATRGTQVSEQISEQIEDLKTWINDVHLLAGSQVGTLEDLKQVVERIARTTGNTADTAEKNAATAEELQSQVHVLQGIIKDLKARVNDESNPQYSVGSDGFDFGENVRFQGLEKPNVSAHNRSSVEHHISNGNGFKNGR